MNRRVAALDLSKKKTGIAWGEVGAKPLGTAVVLGDPKLPEGAMLYKLATDVARVVLENQCGFVIFSEFYASKNMQTVRTNAAVRGAVMAILGSKGIEAMPIPEITARKAAGVDISKRKPHEPKNGWMKERAKAFLTEIGLGHLSEDEGDAAVLLLGGHAVIEIG